MKVGVIGIVSVSVLVSCTTPEKRSFVLRGAITQTASNEQYESIDKRGWWYEFENTELSHYVERAISHNTDIAGAYARILKAESSARVSRSYLSPLFSLDVSSSSAGTTHTPFLQSTNAMLAASYELDLWGRVQALHSVGELNAIAAKYDRDAVAITIAGETVRAFLRVATERARIRIAQRNHEIASQIMAMVEARFRAGATGELDLYQQRASIAGIKARIPVLERSEHEALATLSLLVDLPLSDMRIKAPSLETLMLPRIDGSMPSSLLERRPDIRRVEAQLGAAASNIEAARAAFFPRIALTTSSGVQSAALGSFLGGAAFAQSIVANMVQPLFDGGRLQAEHDLAFAQKMEIVANYRSAVRAAFTDVEVALKAASTSFKQFKLIADQVKDAQAALKISTNRYREGAADFVSVLEAQRVLFSAQDQLAQSRLLLFESRVMLFRALGGAWRGTSD